MVLAHVAVSLCPSFLLVHMALVCAHFTLYPCVQQYPFGLMLGWGGRWVHCCVGPLTPVTTPLARSVYADVREATLAVSIVTLAVSVALFLMSYWSVVHSVVAAAARLSRYPSRHVKVFSGRAESSTGVTAWAWPAA